MIERIIRALKNLGFDLDDIEIAEILWLAVQMQRSGYLPVPELQQQALTSTSKTASTGSQLPLNQNSQASFTKTESSAKVYFPSSQNSDRTSSGLLIKVAAAQALRNQLNISRSLRPFKRQVPSKNEFVFDEIATVESITEGKLLLPVMQPAPERWLELVLVIDEGASMMLWKQTIGEFKQLLERHGAFQDVRTWGLFTDERGKVWLRSRTGSLSRQKKLRNPKELIDPNGRRLFVIISDCVSPAWRNGAIAKALAAWACTSPMAIIQVLPEWLWERSALGVAKSVLLRSLAPGVPNRQLIMTALDLLDENDVVNKIKVPVIALEPESLKNWAQMVASRGDVQIKGFLLALDVEISSNSSESTENSSVKLSAKQRLQRFRLNASPMARKLAGLLASAPISLPVMRLIQQTMLPQSSQVHVAEVFLGGILKPLSPVNEGVEADKIEYDFVDGVRNLLLDAVPLPESTKVLLKVSEYMEQRTGLSVSTFEAMLANPIPSNIPGAILTHPFAEITAQVLRRHGGKYARIVEVLERSFQPLLSTSEEVENFGTQKRIALISVEADPAVDDVETGEARGQNVYVRHIGEALDKLGWQVDIFTRKAHAKQAAIVQHSPNCRTIRLVAGPEEFVPRDNIFPYATEFVKQILKFQKDSGMKYALVHTNYWISAWVGMELKKIQGSKQVHTYHSLGYVEYKSVSTIPLIAKTRLEVEKAVLETAESIVATSPQEKHHMRSLVSSQGNIDIIPCGTDIHRFGSVTRAQARQELSIDPESAVILYVGRFDPCKGIETLVRAVGQSQLRGKKDIKLIIGGGSCPGQSDGMERDRIESIVAELGMRDITVFPGRLGDETLHNYYAVADVCVVPSHYEPFGLVAIEAMASATPVVASNVGGLQFTVVPEETGLLVPPKDVMALAGAIDRILINPGWRDKLGEAGKRRVQSLFSWNFVSNQLSELYKQLLQPPIMR